LTPPAKRSDGASGLAAFLKAEGALAMVNASAGAGGTVFLGAFGERQGSPDPAQPVPLTTLTVASEHYGRIARILAKGIAVTLEADVRNKFTGGNDSAFNILAELPGTDKADDVVMLGAHFDSFHFATGATDNGVNVAVMLEVMRILKASNVPLRRTVRLALWTGEEQGSLGSRAYVARHFVDTVARTRRPEFAKLAAYYNLDNGGGAIRGPMVDQREQLKTEADSTFRVWTRLLRDLGADIVSARGGGGSDHVSFYERGLPGFQFLQDGLDYDTRTHHTNVDTYERVVPEDVRRNAVIVASFVFLTANREKPFPVMRVW
jgi:Zn-dependent M28 family amino/carboxypeptidase